MVERDNRGVVNEMQAAYRSMSLQNNVENTKKDTTLLNANEVLGLNYDRICEDSLN